MNLLTKQSFENIINFVSHCSIPLNTKILKIKQSISFSLVGNYRYLLLCVRPASIEDNPNDDTGSSSSSGGGVDIPRVYLKALSIIEYDTFLVSHATATKVDVQVVVGVVT